MTVSATNILSGPYAANGATTAFPFTFAVGASDEIAVLADGVALSSALYSVSLATVGGTVTFTTAPADGLEIIIISLPAFAQDLALLNNGPFLPEDIEAAFDRSVIRDLYLKAGFDAVVPADALIPGTGLGMFVARDADGDPVFASGTGADAGLRTDLADPDLGPALVAYGDGSVGAALNSEYLVFADASGAAIPSPVIKIRTTGYATAGDGGDAWYVYDAAVDAAYVTASPRASFISANGRGFRVTGVGARPLISVKAFGAKGDGVTVDHTAIKAAVDYQRLRSADFDIFVPAGNYYTGTLPADTHADQIRANFDGICMRGVGERSRIFYPVNQGSRTFIQCGNNDYEIDVNEDLPNILFKDLHVDLVRANQFCNAFSLRYPIGKIEFDNVTMGQSAVAKYLKAQDLAAFPDNPDPDIYVPECIPDSVTALAPNTGDQWGISLAQLLPAHDHIDPSLTGSNGSPEHTRAAIHCLIILDCTVYGYVQLTANGPRGLRHCLIDAPRVFQPRANGITFGSIGKVYRIGPVWVINGKFRGVPGRCIMFGPDTLVSLNVTSPLSMLWQHYMRGIFCYGNDFGDGQNTDNSGGQHIYVVLAVQGTHDIFIGPNIHNGTRGAYGGQAFRIQSSGSNYAWADTYHGGVDPVINAADFITASDKVALTDHNLQHATGIQFTPVAGADVMPAGVCAQIDYFVGLIDLGGGVIDEDNFELYERIDPITGTLYDKVNIGAGASGTFTVSHSSIWTNLVTKGKFYSRVQPIIANGRGGNIDGKWELSSRIQTGSLDGVNFGGTFRCTNVASSVLMDFDQGGARGVTFDGARLLGRGNTGTGTGGHLIRGMFGDTAHNDLDFSGATIEVDYSSSVSAVGPTMFYEESTATTPANRKGPGPTFQNIRSSKKGTPATSFINIGPLAAKNVAAVKNLQNPNGDVYTTVSDYVLTINDIERTILNDSGSNRIVTVPLEATVRFPTGAVIYLSRTDSGTFTVAGATGAVIIKSIGSALALNGAGAEAKLTKLAAAETWQLSGNLA